MHWFLPTVLSGVVLFSLSCTYLYHPQASWLWISFAFINYANTNIHKIWVGKGEIKFFDYVVFAMIVRFLVSFGCFAVCLFVGVQNIRLFTLYFIFLYLFFLCFEIYNLLANLHPDSKPH
jgi:hypothetical protein